MTILHVYSEKRPAQQLETLETVERLTQQGFVIDSRKTTVDDDSSYWQILMEYWGKQDLIQFQQDVVPTVEMLERLVLCPELACTHAHKLQTGYGLWVPTYNPTSYKSYLPIAMEWYDPPFPEFVRCSGMALVKISKELQEQIPLSNYALANSHWSMIDTWVSSYMDLELNEGWHVHTPEVKHNHF